jgi:hydroxypyruvate isomerase
MKPPLTRRRFLGASAAAAGVTLIPSCGPVSTGGPAPGDDPTSGDQRQAENLEILGRTPHTKFSVNIETWWKDLPFLERIDQAADLGFPAIEFWEWRGQDIDAIAGKVESRGIGVSNLTGWGFTPGLNDPANHDQFVREIEAGCRIARKLKAPRMTVVGGDDQPGMTQAEMHRHIIAGLKRAAPFAENQGIVLALEPMNIRVDHPGHCLYGSAPAIEICREVGSSHVRINWDLYHMQISEGDLCGHIEEGWDYIGYFQLADNPGRNEPGTGEIHYNRVLREIHERGYRGFVGLECWPIGSEIDAARAVARADIW